ncbi:MAG: family 20 glycosylhydrolase [Cytophagaceae bacterium]
MKINSGFGSVLVFISLLLFSCGSSQEKSAALHPSGGELSITWGVITNDYQGTGMFKSMLSIKNNSPKTFDNKGWELYFNFTPARKIIQDSIPESVKLIHINGDFFKLVPAEKFKPLAQGDSFSLSILASYVAIKYSDAPCGFYFVFQDEEGKSGQPELVKNYQVLPFERKEQIKKDKNDMLPLPTAESMYKENLKLTILPSAQVPAIIPTPYSLSFSKDSLLVDPAFEIHYESGLESEAEFLSSMFLSVLGQDIKRSAGTQSGSRVILLQKKALLFDASPEAYQVSVNKGTGIIISGNGRAGVFYGIQSLRALMPLEVYTKKPKFIPVRETEIKDFPQFPYRGLLLDVVRHFHSKESILKTLDLMSFYKLNKLHLHLTDDEAWRLEIEGLPELTEVGARHGHTLTESDRLIPAYGCGPAGDLNPANGYYSRKDFIEILRYAKSRHIEVIPEIDLPGHARAAIKAMDARYTRLMAEGKKAEAEKYLLRDLNDKSTYLSVQLFNDNVICPCQEGIYNFISIVGADLRNMYKEAEAPLNTMHLGGDEVAHGAWEKSPACEELIRKNKDVKTVAGIKRYFLQRSTHILDSLQLYPSVTEDAVAGKEKENGRDVLKTEDAFIKSGIVAYFWANYWGWGNEDLAYKLANRGFKTVLCPVTNLYFDLAYTNEPEEPGLYWGGFTDERKIYEYTPLNLFNCAYQDLNGQTLDPAMFKDKERLTQAGRKNILGLQGMLFSETLKNRGMLEYYMFPKMIALAERAWAKQPAWSKVTDKEKRLEGLAKDWNSFANALGQRELPRLDYLFGGTGYRLPLPGAIMENGWLKANASMPGLAIRFTRDGSEPSVSSELYTGMTKVNGKIRLSTFNTRGRKSRSVLVNMD